MGVFPHVKRTVGALRSPVVADSLGNRQDVCFGECAPEWRTTVAAGTEDDQLVRILQVGMGLKIGRLQASQVHQHLLWSRLACERRNRFVRFAYQCLSF